MFQFNAFFGLESVMPRKSDDGNMQPCNSAALFQSKANSPDTVNCFNTKLLDFRRYRTNLYAHFN